MYNFFKLFFFREIDLDATFILENTKLKLIE